MWAACNPYDLAILVSFQELCTDVSQHFSRILVTVPRWTALRLVVPCVAFQKLGGAAPIKARWSRFYIDGHGVLVRFIDVQVRAGTEWRHPENGITDNVVASSYLADTLICI